MSNTKRLGESKQRSLLTKRECVSALSNHNASQSQPKDVNLLRATINRNPRRVPRLPQLVLQLYRKRRKLLRHQFKLLQKKQGQRGMRHSMLWQRDISKRIKQTKARRTMSMRKTRKNWPSSQSYWRKRALLTRKLIQVFNNRMKSKFKNKKKNMRELERKESALV